MKESHCQTYDKFAGHFSTQTHQLLTRGCQEGGETSFAQTRSWLPGTHACCPQVDMHDPPDSFSGGNACLLFIIGFGLYLKQKCVVCQTKITQFKEYVHLLGGSNSQETHTGSGRNSIQADLIAMTGTLEEV